jgi:hypothetical protein
MEGVGASYVMAQQKLVIMFIIRGQVHKEDHISIL